MELLEIDLYIKNHTKTFDLNDETFLIVSNLRIENLSKAAFIMVYPLKRFSKIEAVKDFFQHKLPQILI